MTQLPYGEWPSPISAAQVARSGAHVTGAVFHADAVWWAETRPDEGGRVAICRQDADGIVAEVLPAPWNARTRVHEYGGGAWAVVDDSVVFAEFSDQRLYRARVGLSPQPVTEAPPSPASVRYADLTVTPHGALLCVRETHTDAGVCRDLVTVSLDASAESVRHLAGGSHFLAYPRLSPNAAQVAWIGWDHPQMPWDGTQLFVADRTDGGFGPGRPLIGSATESVLQPEWLDDDTLVVLSDRNGWWNPYRVHTAGGDPVPLCELAADVGGPLWQLGARWCLPLTDERLLVTKTYGVDAAAVIDMRTGEVRELPLGGLEMIALQDVDGSRVLALCGGSRVATGLRLIDADSGSVADVRVDDSLLPAPEWRSPAQHRTFRRSDGGEVHAFVYPPHHPEVDPPAGHLPPYLVHVHGGPTASASATLSAATTYWTSRGIGVVDVNYGGSTGYGRAYRERLRGQWGVVDVEDTVDVVRGLVTAGEADPHRVAIEGGSAGGWTVLAALTRTDTFACGVSLYGVADATLLAEHTHDFESRYLDSMIGPLPQARATHDERSPLNSVVGLSCPVLLLQELDDPVVPPEQAEAFRDAMVQKHIPHAYLAFEGESHGFRKTETIVRVTEATLSFLGQVLGFTPPDVPRLELTTG